MNQMQTNAAVLYAFMSAHPEQWFTKTEIARATGINVGMVAAARKFAMPLAEADGLCLTTAAYDGVRWVMILTADPDKVIDSLIHVHSVRAGVQDTEMIETTFMAAKAARGSDAAMLSAAVQVTHAVNNLAEQTVENLRVRRRAARKAATPKTP